MRLLLFSNSTNAGEDYLSFTLPYINDFVTTKPKRAVFIPFAGVAPGFARYHEMVNEKFNTLGIHLISIHRAADMQLAIREADLIVVGGGNTFCLLKSLQDEGLLPLLRERALAGVPYIGWSAGSNLACPTICTTNDMPIVQPQNFKALNLIPFQINPHYTEFKTSDHTGETRQMRIEEYLLMNRESYVVGLREGTMLEVNSKSVLLRGDFPAKVFKYGMKAYEIQAGEELQFNTQ